MAITYYPRPEILAHPGFEQGHVVIEASAGTGKTYTLEHLVLDLVIHGRADIEQILVVTFTDAATRELRERIRALIRKVCDGGTPDKPAERDRELYWKVDAVIRNRLQEALFRFDGAAIFTIHGFCQRILAEQAFLGGRLFNQEHGDGRELFGLAFREEVRRVLAEESPTGDALRSWIEEENSLRELQELLYNCHREGCPERSLLTPRWDPPGFRAAIKSLPRKEELHTSIESFFINAHQKKGYRRLINRLFDILEPGSNFTETVLLIQEWAGKECSINKIRDNQSSHIRRAAMMKGAPDSFKKLAGALDKMMQRAATGSSFFVYFLLPRVQARLRARKLSLGLIDYDDMLLGVQEALNGENARPLLALLRQRWKYALVDEFQDTDPVQWEIFRRIFVDGEDDHHLYIIGDPKQAIYGFRGADVYTYELAKNHLLKECHATRMPLRKNYRSTQELITAVNTLLTATGEGKDGGGFFSGLNRYDEPVGWGKAGPAFENGKPAVPVHLVHLYGEGEPLTADSIRKGLAHFIAREIERLLEPRTGLMVLEKGRQRPLRLSDIYILTRSGREGRRIGEILRRHGIHHAFYKSEGLFKTDEAEALYRLLAAIESPHDPACRMAAWLTPFFEVPLKELMDWKEVEEHHPLIAHLFRWKRMAAGQEWTRLFDDILNSSGLIRRLIFFDRERELTNYLHLFELLLAEAHTRPVTLSDLARGLRALIDGRKLPEGREGDMQRLETDKEAVQILTMHKAKGLEAEVIFVAGGFTNPKSGVMDTQIYHLNGRRCLHIGPAYGEIAVAIEKEIQEEDQRLAYVAMTRARSRLYLPYFGSIPAGEVANGRSYGFRVGKFYRVLQDQLERLHRQGRFNDQRLFLRREVSVAARFWPRKREEAPSGDWPLERLLVPLPSAAGKAGKIKSGRRGVILTSYTRMSRGKGWRPPVQGEEAADWRSEEVAAEVEDTLAGPALPGSALINDGPVLPPGRESGIFLHALLEEIALQDLTKCTFEQWFSQPAVQRRAAICARHHGFSEEYLPVVLPMLYRAFRTPLRVKNQENSLTLEMEEGVAAGERMQAELSFVYPIPEGFHPLLSADKETLPAGADDLPFRAHRGYIRGLIDLVFEHEGKIYLLDWKSDLLPSYDQARLNSHVEYNYRLQAQLYRLAVLRLLAVGSEEEYEDRFGGVLYLFIRGLEPPGSGNCFSRGAWFSRPSWNRVVEEEEMLVTRREWGGEVIK